jgi:hypothetical protein
MASSTREFMKKNLLCKICKKYKSKSLFSIVSKNKKGKVYYRTSCKKCWAKIQKDKYKSNSHKKPTFIEYRKYHLKYHFGITPDDYNTMFEKQNGCCIICGIHQSELNSKLAVDHCHTTKKVRGLLCPFCNNGLGCFKDNINFLSKAIKYLKST